jgi:hypothetical protein
MFHTKKASPLDHVVVQFSSNLHSHDQLCLKLILILFLIIKLFQIISFYNVPQLKLSSNCFFLLVVCFYRVYARRSSSWNLTPSPLTLYHVLLLSSTYSVSMSACLLLLPLNDIVTQWHGTQLRSKCIKESVALGITNTISSLICRRN